MRKNKESKSRRRREKEREAYKNGLRPACRARGVPAGGQGETGCACWSKGYFWLGGPRNQGSGDCRLAGGRLTDRLARFACSGLFALLHWRTAEWTIFYYCLFFYPLVPANMVRTRASRHSHANSRYATISTVTIARFCPSFWSAKFRNCSTDCPSRKRDPASSATPKEATSVGLRASNSFKDRTMAEYLKMDP